MPHVIVRLWPGKSEQQKTRLAEEIAKDVMDVLKYGEESVSVAIAKSNHRRSLALQPWRKLRDRPRTLGKRFSRVSFAPTLVCLNTLFSCS